MSSTYKPLGETCDEEEPHNDVREEREDPDSNGALTEKVPLGVDAVFTVEEETEDEDGHTLLIRDSNRLERKGIVLLSPDVLFERDSWKYRFTRRALSLSAVVLVLGLLAAGIAMIAVSPSCPASSSSVQSSPNLSWWQTTVIYQCYPRSFQDSDGDGNGDLQGIKSQLDYLVDIGIGAVWFNPIYPSPLKDNGYDISNYTDINPLYGNLEDFKSLLEDIHERSLRVILDFVPNHSSEEHAWFKESRSSHDNSKRDWYIWADGRDDGPPNNWISVFGGSAWTYDNLTQQYYFHQFGYFQPDLNYRNPEVQEAMKDVLRFWLDLGVDGFRVDAVAFLLEDPKLMNESRKPAFTGNCTTNISSSDCYNSLIHNLTTSYDGIHEIIQSWRQVLDSYSKPGEERFMVGEVYGTVSEVVTYYGKHDNEFNIPFNFILLENSNWVGTEVATLVAEWLDSIPEGVWSNWVLGNHDSPRISSKAGVYLARALNVLLMTLPGTPTTYYGEEILMTDVYVRNVSTEERDKARTPMQWNTSANSGFTGPASTPWLPVATNYTVYNVEVENRDSLSSLSLYKKLTALRSNYSALQYTGYRHVYNSTEIFAYLRCHNSSQLLIVINFSAEQTSVDLSGDVTLKEPTVLLSSTLNRTGDVVDLGKLELSGGEAVIIEGPGDT